MEKSSHVSRQKMSTLSAHLILNFSSLVGIEMQKPIIFFDNRVARKILSDQSYSQNVKASLSSRTRTDLVRTISSLLELYSLSNNPAIPKTKNIDWTKQQSNSKEEREKILKKLLKESRAHFSSVNTVDLIRQKRNELIARWNVDNDQYAKNIELLYADKIINASQEEVDAFNTWVIDSLVSNALQAAMNDKTGIDIIIDIYCSCLTENYGINQWPIILTPYKALYWLSHQLSEGKEKEEVEKSSLKRDQDLLDAEGVTLSILGFPERENSPPAPIMFITEDCPKKVRGRCILFQRAHEWLVEHVELLRSLNFTSGRILFLDIKGNACDEHVI